MSENKSKKSINDGSVDVTRYRGATVKGNIQQDIIRFKITWILMLLLFGAIFVRLIYVQILSKDKIVEYEQALIMRKSKQPTYRGMITDRHDKPLAVSAPLISVVFSPRDYALSYYLLKAEEQKLKNSQQTDRVKKELADVQQRLVKKFDLTKMAELSGMTLQSFQEKLTLRENINFVEYAKAYKKDPKTAKIHDILPKGVGSSFMYLKKDVRPEEAQPLLDLDVVGISDNIRYERYYPQPEPNAYLVGYMGKDESKKEDNIYLGISGIEKSYNEMLAGQSGETLFIRDIQGNRLKEVKQIEPEIAGKDLQLTIDSQLQYVLYQALQKVGIEQKAQWATGMVVDIPTGEVLAVSNWPSFNPNNLETLYPLEGEINPNQRNHAFVDKFEPGSVVKPITVAIGLKSGQYSESSLINTSPGTLKLDDDYTIRDAGNYGVVSLEKLLQKSSNVASAKIALSLPPSTFSESQKLFGFGKVSSLNFPLEAKGIVPTPNVKNVSSRATVAYGYGMETTLPQLAQAYSILGANGTLYPLTLIKGTRDNALHNNATNHTITPYAKPASTQIINSKQAKAVVNMMVSVTEAGGTGTLASIDGYRVAGKTGTARVSKTKAEGGGYHEDKYRTLFAGIAPASNPRFTVVIVVEDPQVQKTGSQVSAPVFREVMQEALRLYNVPYDKPLTGKENATPPALHD